MIFIFTGACTFADEPQDLCLDASQIKIIPFRAEPVADGTYNGLIKLGDKALGCLVGQISNGKLMDDPRKAPPYNGFAVGDAALIVVSKITGVSLIDLIDEKSVTDNFSKLGVMAYFNYVKLPKNRDKLSKKLKRKFNLQ